MSGDGWKVPNFRAKNTYFKACNFLFSHKTNVLKSEKYWIFLGHPLVSSWPQIHGFPGDWCQIRPNVSKIHNTFIYSPHVNNMSLTFLRVILWYTAYSQIFQRLMLQQNTVFQVHDIHYVLLTCQWLVLDIFNSSKKDGLWPFHVQAQSQKGPEKWDVDNAYACVHLSNEYFFVFCTSISSFEVIIFVTINYGIWYKNLFCLETG